MPISDEAKAKMDAGAKAAEEELIKLNLGRTQIMPIANWLLKFYMTAGYRRLCKILIDVAKAEDSVNNAKMIESINKIL